MRQPHPSSNPQRAAEEEANNNFQANNTPPSTPEPNASNGYSQPEAYPPHRPVGNGFQDTPGTYRPPTATPSVQVYQNTYPPQKPPVIGVRWSSELFDCGNDVSNTLVTSLLPCMTYGQIAEMTDEGRTSCVLASCFYAFFALAACTCSKLSSSNRLRLRMKFNLVEAPAEDWAIHLFCFYCALCQEYRELKVRGLDPSLGWMGYVAREQEIAMNPPAAQQMIP